MCRCDRVDSPKLHASGVDEDDIHHTFCCGDGAVEPVEFVEIGDVERPAISYGPVEVGDDVVVNTAAVDLGLASGGFDIVHVNLTRGLDQPGAEGAHVMKLNYTSLQHAVDPVETTAPAAGAKGPVAVIALHGQLPCVAWQARQRLPDARIGYIQTWGGALPGALSRVVRMLRSEGLLAGHITDRLGIVSFYVEDLHYNLIVKLLNDRFGIQVRGGCSCAGTYGHYLLHVDPRRSGQITDKIDHGAGLKTRYALLSFATAMPGMAIAKGEMMGRTGTRLHYEMLRNGVPQNPET